MTVLADEAPGAIGPADRIGTMVLVRGALARMRRAPGRLAILAALGGPGMMGVAAVAQALGVDVNGLSLEPADLAYAAIVALASGLIGALTLRALLGDGGRWLRPARGVAEAAGLLAGATLLFLGLNLAYGRIVQAFGWQEQADHASALGFALVAAAIYVAVLLACLKLTFWPLGRLAGRRELTAVASWRLTRRSTRGLVLGNLLFLVPAAGGLTAGGLAPHAELLGATLGEQIAQLTLVAYSFASYGLIATAFHLRIEAPAQVADVFA